MIISAVPKFQIDSQLSFWGSTDFQVEKLLFIFCCLR